MILEVDAVDTFYGETQALFGASLAIEHAKVFALLGPNGAGKTTFFNVLTGRVKPSRGRVLLGGEDVTGLSPHRIAAKGIARSFQIMTLFDEPSQGLAPKIVGDVLATILRMKDEGIASLVVEQNAEIALSVADHAAVIDRGRIVWTGEAAALRDDRGLRQRLLGVQ